MLFQYYRYALRGKKLDWRICPKSEKMCLFLFSFLVLNAQVFLI